MHASLRKICVGAGVGTALMLATAGCGPSTEPLPGATRPVPSAAGVPIGPPAGQQIGAGGGSLSSPDGLVRIDLPAGALQAGTEISIQEITNLAPRGVASAYRLAPHGTAFAAPVTLTFRADLSSASLDDLTVAYQDGSGYWSRVPNVWRDAAAGTLTVTTLHFSDWSLVAGPTPRDLVGTFAISSTIGVPFTVDGAVTLTFAGENAEESFYLLGGTHTPRSPIAVGAATCTPDVPTQALTTNLAELFKSPPDLWWGVSGYWDLSCSDSSGLAIEYAFDTLGLSKVSCARGWVGTPTLGPELVAGSYAIDCGTKGTLTGSLSFQSGSCGQPCLSSNPCHTAAFDCTTGTAVCTDTGNVANGTGCGTDLVCSGGICTPCVANVGCTTQPDPLCHEGITSCSTGTSVCEDGAALPDGTGCGTDLVCSGGVCVTCASNQPCTTQPDPLCHEGVTSCSTGTSVCVNGAALPDGTGCGTDLVCSGGVCVTCASNQPCTTQPDPLCHEGVTSCSTGTSVCVNGAALPNGTTCGSTAGDTCGAGVCVPSRTVLGTRLVTYWPDGGAPLAPVPAPDTYAPPLAAVAALVPRADGGFETYAGTIGASGDISIPNVPVGTYILSFVDGAGAHIFLETAADTVDLGYDVLGRPDATPPLASTPITLDASGLAPWTAGDEIQLVSSNADVFDVPSLDATVTAGATAIQLVDDWFSSALGGPMHLLAASDVLWVHVLATASTTQIGGSTPYPYLSAASAVSVTGLTFTSGTPATVSVALTPTPGTGDVTGSTTTGVDWRLTQFEAQLPAMTGLAVMPAGSVHALSVGAASRALANPAPIAAGSPTLFRLELPAGTGDFATAAGLAYGRFLPADWHEWRGVELAVPVAYALPPATSPFTDHATVGHREAMSPTPATPIVPTLLPVQSPAVNGSGAFGALTGVTATPTLSWSAPPLPSMAPTSYTVEVLALDVSGTSTIATPVASWRVGSTAVTVPRNLLQAGRTYYARITARASAPEPLATKPLSGEHAAAWATTLTGTFSP